MLSPPNSSTSNPKRASASDFEIRAARSAGGSSRTHGNQQTLTLERFGRQPLHDPLEQHPLVRDVLIDDAQPLVVHGDDERVAELPERDHRADRPGGADAPGELKFARNVRAVLAVYVVGEDFSPPGVGGAHATGKLPPWSAPGIDGCIGRPGSTSLVPKRQLRRRPFAERIAERMTNELVHLRLLFESHLRLRRMHVHVDAIGRHFEEQVHFRTALLVRRHAVGVENRVRDRPILDDAAIDEDVLRSSHRSLLGQCRDEAVQSQSAEFAIDLNQILPIAIQLIQPIGQARDRRDRDDLAAGTIQGEADLRIAEREAA